MQINMHIFRIIIHYYRARNNYFKKKEEEEEEEKKLFFSFLFTVCFQYDNYSEIYLHAYVHVELIQLFILF